MKTLVIALLALGVISILLSACTVEQNSAMTDNKDDAMMKNEDAVEKTDDIMMNNNDNSMAMEDKNAMIKEDSMMMETSFSGNMLADESSSKYIEFNKADYDRAVEEGKTIVLYFYASWCPTCQAEQPDTHAAFNQLDNKDVVGFRVNYKDSDTDSVEEDLAREFGISYQHTKVIIKDGERVLKSPESWDTDRYLTEINAVA